MTKCDKPMWKESKGKQITASRRIDSKPYFRAYDDTKVVRLCVNARQ
jgi:hypothetical protein